jgi:hypothetical protein
VIQLPDYHTLNIRAFSRMFQRQGLTNSYKLFFFKAILESCKKQVSIVTFNQLFSDMFNEAFPLVHTYKLTLGNLDQLERMIKKYPSNLDVNKKSIEKFASNIDPKSKSDIITSYVVFRLLRPFYEDFKFSSSDSIVNKQLQQLINTDLNALYYIDLDSKTLTINQTWMTYINHHLKLIDEWYKYNLIVFLQSRNPSSPNIPYKVDSSLISRNLTKETTLWKFAIDRNPSINFDIYLNQRFSVNSTIQYGDLSLDHVIPYDFVMHKELWNLTPTHKNINSMKNNRLPQDQHILDFSKLQYSFFKTVQVFYELKKNETHPLSEYEYLNSRLTIKNFDIHEDEFVQILSSQIKSLHTIANNQGFIIWNHNL